jgi:hypothetical protein
MANWTSNQRGVLRRQFGIPEGEQPPSKELRVAPAPPAPAQNVVPFAGPRKARRGRKARSL